MAKSIIQSEGLNLADDYAFTGTVSGISSGIKQSVVHQETTKSVTWTLPSTAGDLRHLTAANCSDSTTKMEVAITPTSSTAKIFIMADMFYEANANGHSILFTLIRDIGGTQTRLGQADSGSNKRGGIAIAINNYDGNYDSTPDQVYLNFIDEPNTTSEVKYILAASSASASTVLRLNTIYNTASDTLDVEHGTSMMMVQELG